MSDHWGRLENHNRSQRDRQNREMADSWRREKAEWRRIEAQQADLPSYPKTDDDPPGRIRFTLSLIAFLVLLIGLIPACCIVGRMFFRV